MKHVKLVLEHENIEGILVKEDERHVVIKLSSGYNIGISRNKIRKIEDIHSHQELVKEQSSERIIKFQRIAEKIAQLNLHQTWFWVTARQDLIPKGFSSE